MGEPVSSILQLKVTNFNIVTAVLGGFLSLLGLVSYLVKERFYLSEPIISLFAGLVLSPHACNFVKPLEYAGGSDQNLNAITLYFCHLVLGVQLVLAGIQLPSKYLRTEWRSLFWLLGPGMCAMWISTSLLVWAMVPDLPFLHALAVGSCVTPTDPVLSNNIVKGKFADKNLPKDLQKIIIAESGANDGLGYPFLFLALYLIKYTQDGGMGTEGGAGKAMGYWFGITWGYTIIMSVLYGWVVGWIFKDALHWAEKRKYVDRESFLVFAITIALFIVGTAGMLGSDDVLANFVAGNSFTWDDWFRLETMDDSFQPTIDMILNVAIFLWYGAIAPWHDFAHNSVIPIYRLIFLGILVLLLRRLPMVIASRKKIWQIEDWRQTWYMGFFGPIGVSAIFYLYVSLEFLHDIKVNGREREDARRLDETLRIVVWFLAICSIIVHGLTIPIGKLAFNIPRTMSRAVSTEREYESFTIREVDTDELRNLEGAMEQSRADSRLQRRSRSANRNPSDVPPLPIFRIGGRIIRDPRYKRKDESSRSVSRRRPESTAEDGRPKTEFDDAMEAENETKASAKEEEFSTLPPEDGAASSSREAAMNPTTTAAAAATTPPMTPRKTTIRFPDNPPASKVEDGPEAQ